jgi:acyl-CoA synthetase (AMP-forming)/AMP-acid ligase II
VQAENKPWFSSLPKDLPRKLEYPKVPLHEFLEKTANEHPEKAAIAYFRREITYAELDSLASRFAGALAALGVKKGDGVALFMPNITQLVIAY